MEADGHSASASWPLLIHSVRPQLPQTIVARAKDESARHTTSSIEELYGDIWGQEDPVFDTHLDQSLHPRHATVLYDMFVNLGVRPEDTALDVGCRDATHAMELVHRCGCRVIAVDPIPRHLTKAAHHIAHAGLHERIIPVRARIEALPLDTNTVACIWCRDMLNHVDLPTGLAECFRVLASGGTMLIYQTFATALCEPKEAQRLYDALAIVPANMSPTYFERTAQQVGFTILFRDPIDSEWRENWAEGGDKSLLEDLLCIARLRRSATELIQKFGKSRYEVTYADCLWGIYQMLGKLCPTVYILQKPGL